MFLLPMKKNSKIDSYLKKTSKQHKQDYDAIYDEYKKISKLIFDTKINTPAIQRLYKHAKDADDKEKAIIREKLFNELKETYQILKSVNIKQLHFHLPDNESFLRFHKPSKFGDNLSNIRETIKYVNKRKKPVDGFEEGRIYNGYRFVFPLFADDEHIGSVEVSFSGLAISKGFNKNFDLLATLLVSTDVIDQKVFASEKSNYLQSELNGFCIEKKTLNNEKKVLPKHFSKTTHKKIQNNLRDNKLDTFSMFDEKLNKVLTFIKIHNPITKKLVGMFMITSHSNYIINKTKNYYTILILSNLLMFFILYIMYKESAYGSQMLSINKKLNRSISLFDNNVLSTSSDLNGNITYVSDALCKLSEYTSKELIGRPHSAFRHPDTKKDIFKDLWETISSGRVWRGELKNRKKGGGFYWVNMIVTPDYDMRGSLVGYSSIQNDITAEKAKEQFMANMSHELRTPLNSIIGFSSILTKKLHDKQSQNLAKQITGSSKSLLNLINDILDLSKINDEKFTISPYNFNAYDEAKKLSEEFNVLTSQTNMNLTSQISENLKGTFFGDWQRIQQVIYNLISNALKFTKHDGNIAYRVKYVNNSLVISIEDDGIGMDEATQNKVFKPFVQADGSITREYGGTGLGLSITQKLVEIMDGTIELSSKEGEGSTFTVNIPLERISSDEMGSEEIIADEEKPHHLNMHILVAEDNKTNQMLITMMLEEFGITCDIADDGLEATTMFDPMKHRLILMDENMPNMNGIEAMKTIREKYKKEEIVVIALTANAMKGDREKFLKAGMNDYVSKPIDDELLYECLRRFA